MVASQVVRMEQLFCLLALGPAPPYPHPLPRPIEVSRLNPRWSIGLLILGMALSVGCWLLLCEPATSPSSGNSSKSSVLALPLVAAESEAAAADPAEARLSAPTGPARDAPAGALRADRTPIDATSPAARRGFRATPEQRMADLLEYQSAEHLLALREGLQQRAAAGDADAANRLADIYEECAGVQWAEQEFARASQPIAGVWPGSSPDSRDPRRFAELAIGQQRCRGLIPAGDPKTAGIELLRALRTHQALALELGYPGTLPTNMSEWQKPGGPEEWARSAALALLADGTPEALRSLSDSIASDATHYSGEAWLLAACELGYPCNMPVASMRVWCVQYGTGCDASGRLEFTRQLTTPRQWRLAQAQRDEILAHLRNGRIDALMLSVEGDPGGGG